MLVLIVLIGVPMGALNTAIGPVTLAEVPSRFLGRVISLINPVQQVANLTAAAAGAVRARRGGGGLHRLGHRRTG